MIQVSATAVHFANWKAIDAMYPGASKKSKVGQESIIKYPKLVGGIEKDPLALLHGFASFFIDTDERLDFYGYTVHVRSVVKEYDRAIFMASGSLFSWKLHILHQCRAEADYNNRRIANMVYDIVVSGGGSEMFQNYSRQGLDDSTYILRRR